MRTTSLRLLAALGLPAFAAAASETFVVEQQLLAPPPSSFSEMGTSVAVSGTTLVACAPEDTWTGTNGTVYRGTAHVFVFESGAWTLQATLTHPDPALVTAVEDFGDAVAIDGDTIAIGTQLKNSFTGSVVVFERAGSTWSSGTEVIPPSVPAGSTFGGSIAIEGDRMLIGAVSAPGVNASGEGAAYVLERVAGAWVEVARLYKADGQPFDNLGRGVALDGDTALIGDPTDSFGGISSGSATFFTHDGSSWIEGQTVTAPGAQAGDDFGLAVALAGDVALVGAWLDDTGNPGIRDGSAHVFERIGGAWTHVQALGGTGALDQEWFGHSVAIDGGRLLVGSPGDELDNGLLLQNEGSAYVFERTQAGWQQSDQLFHGGGTLGWSVAFDGPLAVVGAPDASVVSFEGCAYVFRGPVPAVTYCTAGFSASGCAAAISASGTPSASAPSGFLLQVQGVEGQKSGLFYFGTTGRQSSPWGNGTSVQCVVPPVARTPLSPGNGSSGSCDGARAFDLNAYFQAKPALNPGIGATVQAQFWYRDPFSTSNQKTSLSDAIEFVAGP